MPLMGIIGQTSDKRKFLIDSYYPGEMGHVRPASAQHSAWVKAILTSPTGSIEEILTIHHRLRQDSTALNPRSKASLPEKSVRSFDPADLETSALLARIRAGRMNNNG